MSLKETLKKIPGLGRAVKGAKGVVRELKAIPNYLAERKIRRSGPIRVVFLCQYIPAWHKLQPVYDQMRSDSRFEPVLLCVPSGIKDSELTDPTNDTLEYFQTHGYPEARAALQADGTWLDLRSLEPAYVFYPRPYNAFMPRCYHSGAVSRYSRICLVLYGMNTTCQIVDLTLNRDFFRHTYCYFAELPYSKTCNEKKGWLLHQLGLQESVYFGMPGIELIHGAKESPRPAWDFSENAFRVMWTPRWTTDLSMGGSNFFTHYEALLEFAQRNPDADLLFRPHPLMFDNFLKTGEMTRQQVDSFAARCESLPNVSLDKEKEYAATFWGTSVMVSDISGMIPEYFATGKPLIFCASNMILTPEETTARMLEASYIVHNSEELTACLQQLKQGIDPLAEKRQQLVEELFSAAFRHPAESIVEYLAKSFRKEETI